MFSVCYNLNFIDIKMSDSLQPLWKPGKALIEQSNLKKYMDWLFVKKGLHFKDYEGVWEWSVTDLEDFWASLWEYFNIKAHDMYFDVISRPREGMMGTEWFTRSRISYAEHVFRNKNQENPAIIFQSEREGLTEISWAALESRVAAVAAWLRKSGIRPGDRVAAVVPNCPEAIVAFLATNAVGGIWSSCSPDFGHVGIVDRFRQIEPVVLIGVDGYTYNGKPFSKMEELSNLVSSLPSVQRVVLIPYLDPDAEMEGTVSWKDILVSNTAPLEFLPVSFSHPIWILYSSGTTGKPKAITHSVGGCLLEHLKALVFHQNVKQGDRFFWYSTTGWMMWNYAVSSLLTGATLVIYDGSPAYPDKQSLWNLAEKARITHFGGGAAYFSSCMKEGVKIPGDRLRHLQTIGSTGSPLAAQVYEWIYQQVRRDVWLISLSGGTDICSAFVSGSPLLPVYAGEIQCRMLGCKMEAYNENGVPVINEVGEMIIAEPMPSMPLYFWGDPENRRYRSSYFEMYPDVWRHGDWIKITSRGSVIIYGRSDTTRHRAGVRIGTAEIYSVIDQFSEVRDSLVVYPEDGNGEGKMSLFVVMNTGETLTDALKKKICAELRAQYTPRHIPDEIIEAPDIPYTISGKKMEAPVKKILQGEPVDKVVGKDTLRNPGSLPFFVEWAKNAVV